eukprot:1998341-Pyramimonas_sp.AAC.1
MIVSIVSSVLEASWALLGASWDASWAALGCPLGALGVLQGPPNGASCEPTRSPPLAIRGSRGGSTDDRPSQLFKGGSASA